MNGLEPPEPSPEEATVTHIRVSEIVTAHMALAGEAGAVERIRMTTEEQLTVVHAWILKLLSPATLINQSPTIFKFNYRGGVVRIDGHVPGRARLSIWAVGLFPEWYTHSGPSGSNGPWS